VYVCIAVWDPINHHHISVHVLNQVTDIHPVLDLPIGSIG
jgi:hypothetical protein